MFKGLRKKASILLISSQTLNLSSTTNPDSSQYEKVLNQVRDFEIALQSMDYVLDDRSGEGVKLLRDESKKHKKANPDQPTAIFPLAMGVMEFIEATLGFEPEVMAKAHITLNEAESASLANAKYNVKYNLATSHIYPPGTEFQVTNAELTLLNALLMLLQENNGVVEGAKALFKLRRAYQSLDATYKKIKELEPLFNKNIAKFRKMAGSRSFSTVDLPGYTTMEDSSASLPEDLKLMKNLEKIYQMRKARVEGTSLEDDKSLNVNLFNGSDLVALLRDQKKISPSVLQNSQFLKPEDSDDEFSDALENPFADDSSPSIVSRASPGFDSGRNSLLNVDRVVDAESILSNTSSLHLHVSTIDEFIHSGVQLCFGILQVVLSLIPPAIGKVLSIVGFKGDRETGLKMLWRTAITSRNIHGDLALLCLLVFYDGPIQFVDTGFYFPSEHDSNVKSVLNVENLSSVSDEELAKIMKNPQLYTPQILRKARKNFPHSALWVLQEGRILAAEEKLDEALEVMQSFTDNFEDNIQMQQVKSLLIFDRAHFYSFRHDFDESARDFAGLIKISNWSQGVYLYLAGACYLGKYRMIKMGLIEGDADKYAGLAEKYLKEAPTYVPGHGINASSRKGGIGGGNKQMPFDKFILRKTKQFDANQKKYPHLSYIECIGTSPIHEIMYFWNAYNRMPHEQLEIAYKILDYTGTEEYSTIKETSDEAMIRYFLQSIVLRQLGRVKEGQQLLDTKVISAYVSLDSLTNFRFTRMTYSPYLYPTALYEKSMFIWKLRTSAAEFDRQEVVSESLGWLKRAEMVSDIGDYELSNRTSMRIKAASEKLEQLLKEARES